MTPLDTNILREAIRRSWCAPVEVKPAEGGRLFISTLFEFDDGDSYAIYAEPSPEGGIRLTDCGSTLMRLSYTLDVGTLRDGLRAELKGRVLDAGGVRDDDGQLVIDCVAEDLGRALASMVRVITRVTDIEFLNKARVQATFLEDLGSAIGRIVPKTVQRYVHPVVGEDYPVDWMIEGKTDPVFVFGIANQDKARLATIVLQAFILSGVSFDSILVFDDQAQIPRCDLARLSNVGGEQVSSLLAIEDLERKIRRRAA